MTVDGRGRIYLPVWLRRHPGFLIGTHADPEASVVVIVPASLFDAIGDQLSSASDEPPAPRPAPP